MALMKDEEKQLLLDRYVDIEWPDDVTDLRCVRCQRVVINHHVSNCQHLYCNNCTRVFSDGGRWKCPQCQDYVTQLDDQDLEVELKIYKLRIFCPNKKYGCKYEDQLRKIPTHLMTCVDTREAALPVEYTGTNRIEAVVGQLIKVNGIIGELKEGMKEMKDRVEEKFSQLERKSDEMDTKFNALMERVDSMERKSQDIRVERELTSKKYAEESVLIIRSQLESMDDRINEKESFLELMMKQMSLNIEDMKIKMVSMTEEIKTHNEKMKEQERQLGEVNAAQQAVTETMARMKNTEDEKNGKATKIMESVNQRIQKNESLLQQTSSQVDQMRMKMVSMNQQLETLQDKTDVVNTAQNALTERMNGMDKTAEDRQLANKKNTEDIQSMKSMLESINQRVGRNESLLKQTTEQTTSNVEEMRMKMVSMTQQQETLQYKIQERSEELNSLPVESYDWTIKDVKKLVSQDKWELESEVFRFIGYKYDIKAKLKNDESGIRIYLQFNDGDTNNQSLNKFGLTGFKFIMKSQGINSKEKSIIRETDLRYDDCFNKYGWILGCPLPSALLSPPYMKDDCIKITILFEPPSIDRSFVSNNGILIWKMYNYKTKKQEQEVHQYWSPSFYTSPHGYRVKTRLLINYTQPLEFEVNFLTGEHDDSLTLHFPHKTTITLFNQLDPSKNLSKSVEQDNVYIYFINLESSKLIEDNGFIKDDSLLFQVVIEPK